MEKIQVDFKRFQDLLHDADLPEEVRKVFVLMAELDTRYGARFAIRVLHEAKDALNPVIDRTTVQQLVKRAEAMEGDNLISNLWLSLAEKFEAFATHLPDEYDFEADSSKLPAFLSKYLTSDAFHWIGTNYPELLIIKTNNNEKDRN